MPAGLVALVLACVTPAPGFAQKGSVVPPGWAASPTPVPDSLLPPQLRHFGKPVPAAKLPPPYKLAPAQAAFLDTLEERTFRWFWDLSDTSTGLTPDRWPTPSFVSVASVGFALTAYPIGVEHKWVTRAAARERVLRTLRFFWNAKQDTARAGVTGYRGFFYHFLDADTGERFKDVELSTIDTALMLAGVLFCQSYFDGPHRDEARIRALADSLYRRVEWTWIQPRAPKMALAWSPEEGFMPWDWGGLNETMILFILALGSPTHAIPPETYREWSSHCRWGNFYSQEHIGFAPLFGHQYTQVWLDLRGIQDSTMRAHQIDWFENSRRATYAQRAYAISNPTKWDGYGERLWGLTACDGAIDTTLYAAGRTRQFHTYEARGASFVRIEDDGTVAPTAVGGSLAFAPEITIPTLMAMRADYGADLFGKYGFIDALNPTLSMHLRTPAGRVVPGVGWFDTDYLGIDQGPILAMAENLRTGLVWRVMRKNPHVIRGLQRGGFRGGWLEMASGAAAPVPIQAPTSTTKAPK